jgi:hypothetical protein
MRCQRLINQLENLIQDGGENNATLRSQIRSIKEQIAEMTSTDNELSAVAISCLENNELFYLTRN